MLMKCMQKKKNYMYMHDHAVSLNFKFLTQENFIEFND